MSPRYISASQVGASKEELRWPNTPKKRFLIGAINFMYKASLPNKAPAIVEYTLSGHLYGFGESRSEMMDFSILFCIENLKLRVPLNVVQEVLMAAEVVRAPGATGDMIGWINVRGDLIAVFDLRKRLGLTVRHENPDDVFVLVTNRDNVIAILADEVIGVSEDKDQKSGAPSDHGNNAAAAEISIFQNGEFLLSIELASLCADAILPIAR